MKYLKYNHPAAMKYRVGKIYELEELKNELDIETIKRLFIPINFKWQDLETKRKIYRNEENDRETA